MKDEGLCNKQGIRQVFLQSTTRRNTQNLDRTEIPYFRHTDLYRPVPKIVNV